MFPFFVCVVRYSVVVDAGPTETRADAYSWDNTTSFPDVVLRATTTSAQSLMAAARDLSLAATVISPLLEWAKTQVPAESRPDTEIYVLGTAEMRRLDPDLQKQIMDEVRRLLVADGAFKLTNNSTLVLSAVDEAGLEWVATNVAMRRMAAESRLNRLSTLSIGNKDARFASEIEVSDTLIDNWVYNIKYASKSFLLFLSAFEGYGIDEAIISHAVVLAGRAGVATVDSPCFNSGWSQTVESITLNGKGNYDECVKSMGEILQKPECGAENCMFNGIPRVIYNGIVGLRSLYDARAFFGMDVNATLSQYDAKAREFCAKSFATVQAEHPDQPDAYVYCFAVAYQNSFLREGLGATDEVYITRLDKYDSQPITFALGVPLTDILPSQLLREPLKWYEILIVVLIFGALAAVIIGIIVCCCLAWRQRKREQNRIVLLESHWREAELDDDPEWDQKKPEDERLGDAFLKVAGMIGDAPLADLNQKAHDEMKDALSSLPDKMAPKIQGGEMRVEYVPNDADKVEGRMKTTFNAVGNVNLQKPKLADEKMREAVTDGLGSMMQPERNPDIELDVRTMSSVVTAAVDKFTPTLRLEVPVDEQPKTAGPEKPRGKAAPRKSREPQSAHPPGRKQPPRRRPK